MAEEGVVIGFVDGTFRPGDPITVGQAAAMFGRFSDVVDERISEVEPGPQGPQGPPGPPGEDAEITILEASDLGEGVSPGYSDDANIIDTLELTAGNWVVAGSGAANVDDDPQAPNCGLRLDEGEESRMIAKQDFAAGDFVGRSGFSVTGAAIDVGDGAEVHLVCYGGTTSSSTRWWPLAADWMRRGGRPLSRGKRLPTRAGAPVPTSARQCAARSRRPGGRHWR